MKSKGVSHSCPCRLFREHWVMNLPRADFKGSTDSLKSCRSESVKKIRSGDFSVIYGRFSSEKYDFYAIVHNGYDGSAIWTNFQVIFLGSHAGYLVSTGAYVYLERILRALCLVWSLALQNLSKIIWSGEFSAIFGDFPSKNGISML